MVLTFTVILLGLLLLIPPLKKNSFYMVHAGLVILAAYYVENRWFTVTPFHPKTLLLFSFSSWPRSTSSPLSPTARTNGRRRRRLAGAGKQPAYA